MKVERQKIVKFCEDYLKVKDFEDYCVNGLQVEGKDEISKIITGVSLSQKLIQEAINKKADMIMVHHGIFINMIGNPPSVRGVVKNRIKTLLENDINLCGFHLPLDAHSKIGNNISLCKLLEVKKPELVYVGYIGELEKEKDFDLFVKEVNQKLGEIGRAHV